MELKKLTLSHKKCNRIHIGKCKDPCPELKLHEANMKDLGDCIDKTGKIKATIDDRVGIRLGNSEWNQSNNKVGRYKLEIGLQLRQAMLVIGLLFNSEA